MQIERYLNRARNSIGSFCKEECNAYCCRKGTLPLTLKEAKKTCGINFDIYIKQGKLKALKNGNYSLVIEDGCPQLKDGICQIHTSNNRGKICGEFPIFLKDNKEIFFSTRCLAVKTGKFYPIIHKLKKEGYIIRESDSIDEKSDVLRNL